MITTCIAPDCENEGKYRDKKYCNKHYLRLSRYGSLDPIVCFLCNRPTVSRKKTNRKDVKHINLNKFRFFSDKILCTNCYKRSLQEIIFIYFKEKCNCCGEDNKHFLQIDHINNDGYLDRKIRRKDYLKYYTNIIRNIDNFQLLCANCNFGKLMNEGICPHKGIKRQYGKHRKNVTEGSSRFTQNEIDTIQQFARSRLNQVFREN